MLQLYAALKNTEPFKGAATAHGDFLWDFARSGVMVKVSFKTPFSVEDLALKPPTDNESTVEVLRTTEGAKHPVNALKLRSKSTLRSTLNASTLVSKHTTAAAKHAPEVSEIVQSPVAKPSEVLQEGGLKTPAARPPPCAPPWLTPSVNNKAQQPLAVQALPNSAWGSGSVSSDVSSLLLDLQNDEDNESMDNASCIQSEDDEDVEDACASGHLTPLTPNNLHLLNHSRRQHSMSSKNLKWNPVDAFSPTNVTSDQGMPWPKVRAIAEAAADALAKKTQPFVKPMAATAPPEEKEEKEHVAHVTDAAANSRFSLLSSEQIARSAQNRQAARIKLLDRMHLTSPPSAYLEATFVKPNDSTVLAQQVNVCSSNTAPPLAPTTPPREVASLGSQANRAETFASSSSLRSHAGEYDFAWMQRDAGIPTFRLVASPAPRSKNARQVTHPRKRPFSFCDLTSRKTSANTSSEGRISFKAQPLLKRIRL